MTAYREFLFNLKDAIDQAISDSVAREQLERECEDLYRKYNALRGKAEGVTA